MRDRVKHVVARVLEVDPSEIADDAATEQFAAWDSLRQLELVLELEAEFGVRVSSDTITELTSVPKIEEYLAQSAASDALTAVLAKLDTYEGRSRFTTWAYKFVMFEVSAKVARHPWHRQMPGAEASWDQTADAAGPEPDDCLGRRAQLEALSAAIGELTERQREVFVAIALNDVPIDVMADRLGTNRNAVYKNLFDARRCLRTRMAAAGYPLTQ